MANKLIFSVSDSEIFDAYMSAPSHFTQKRLLEEGRRRSILYSKHEDCASLARKLSRQVYGLKELQPIEVYFSQIGRTDKTAAIQINAALNQAELKSIIEEFAGTPEADEEFTTYLDGPDLVVNTIYTQTDFSRNRFRQRQEKEAKVRFEIGSDSTTVTMPATEKGREIVAALRNKIEEKRKAELRVTQVDLSAISDPTVRTSFFTRLASEFPDSTLNDVLRVKLQGAAPSPNPQPEEEQLEDDEDGDLDNATPTEEAVAGVLRAAALNGQDLFGTKVFQELRKRGFYITSLTWRSRLQEPGNPIVEFYAGFEDPESCSKFKYSANVWKVRQATGEYNESFTSIPPLKRAELLKALQRFAMSTMQSIGNPVEEPDTPMDEGGGDNEPS